MLLTLYRRHHRTAGKCSAGYPLNFRSYETDELRRGWKKCLCPIYAVGTLSGAFKRVNTKRTSWAEAKAIASQWETEGSWNSPIVVAPPPPVAVPSASPGITIDRAVRFFMTDHTAHLAPNTQKKYSILMAKLVEFSRSKGFVLLEQCMPADIREFRQSWKVSPLTASKDMSIVKAFFEFAVTNEWIERNPARLVKNPRLRAGDDPRNRERLPFTDEELARMFTACANEYGKQPIRWSRDRHDRPAGPTATVNYRFKWTGQDLADFIAVSVYTGLRISDVCTFHIDRLQTDGSCQIRTAKNGRKVSTWIPDWLQDRIRRRAEEVGPLIFGSHTTTDTNVITDVWRRKLKRLWSLCGPWAEKPTPHRFRHTFARILLERPNVTVRDVAELLGDTEEMVRRHYASWVVERQDRLTKVLREAFLNTPKPVLD